MSYKITRRRMLKMVAATTAAAALAPTFHARARYPIPPDPGEEDENTDAWVLMGRAIHTLAFYDEPSTSATRLTTLRRDQSFLITGEVRAPFSAHNDLWYETPLGYVHSAWVLPVRVYPPQPFIRNVGAWGFWGEVSQIFTEARNGPHLQAGKVYRFYGGTVYHIVDAYKDEEGTGWYKIFDELPPTDYQWVLARDVRRIPRAEMAPIHPFAGEKRIEVDLKEQRLTCYEGAQVAFTTLVASGVGMSKLEDGTVVDLSTHTGETSVLLKQVSRHMSNRPQKPGDPPPPVEIFDLPGIPWNVFFDLSGTAIHGTYWHNDFGLRRSHGCLNVSCETARWIYRWVHPIGGYEDDFVQSDRRVGTPISIF
ncbi:MAG: L,D-transpeptidase [Chloroflexota bacterium]|nr:L,D-transpeptidase [Chloroflexota bacterium]